MAIVTLQHVSFNYGTNWALKDINCTVDPGDFYFITGSSGAGKTTLLRMLYGALQLRRGKAEVAGFNLQRLNRFNLPLLRRELGVVFQDFKILTRRSVFDNVALALEVRGVTQNIVERRVRAVLRSLDLEKKSRTICEELAGGEQQRVAIARAIVVNPRILLADEPSGNLDPQLSLRLVEIFKHFNAHGTTVILATHSPELIASMPRAKVLRLEKGAMCLDV